MKAELPRRTLDYLASGASAGQRNVELLAAACQYRDAGYSRARAQSELTPRAVRDGLPEREAMNTIASAFSKSQRTPIKAGSPNGVRAKGIVTPEERERIEQARRKSRLVARATHALSAILSTNARPPAEYFDLSPVRLLDDPINDWRLLLSLFAPDDVVWIGGTFDSAAADDPTWKIEKARQHFRTASDWLKEPCAPAQLTNPCAFKAGSHSRCNEQVLARRFLVVESDVLTKERICAVFHWMEQFCRLRAIVDTAGKSLHGWFDVPPPTVMDELRTILPAIGCDPALFTDAQPCRLPGALRDGKFQSLLYIDLGGKQ